MVQSLKLRLFLVGGLLIIAFLLLTGIAINTALEHYTEQAEEQRLQGISYSLLAASEVNDQGILDIELQTVAETRLRQPESGLSSFVINNDGETVWESISHQPPNIKPRLQAETGQWLFNTQQFPHLAFGFEWVDHNEHSHRFTLHVQDQKSPLFTQKQSFARKLWTGLAIAAGLLLAVLLGLFSWGLSPLEKVVKQLGNIKEGKQQRLNNAVPKEIQPLTDSINRLLHQQLERQKRYKNAVSDLAHSLKTPLAVLKTQIPSSALEQQEQLSRIDQIVSYQLQRASLDSTHSLRASIVLNKGIERTINALTKVYADKNIQFLFQSSTEITYPIDQGDWLELCGNLLDNAAKFAETQIQVELRQDHTAVYFTVDDDGPGFPEQANALLNRGKRADSLSPGQGIGLAMVREIVHIHQADILLTASPTGGASVQITLPL